MRKLNLDMFDPNAEEQKPVRELGTPIDNYPTIEKPKPKAKSSKSQPRNPTTPQTHNSTTPQVGVRAAILAALQSKPDDYATFRCTPEVIDKAEEILILLKRRYKVKVQKYELFSAALAALLWEIEQGDKEPDLISILKERNEAK